MMDSFQNKSNLPITKGIAGCLNILEQLSVQYWNNREHTAHL